MDEIGIVKNIDGLMAVVLVERRSACEQCKAGCKITGSGAEIEAVNQVKARVGQKVRVVLRPYSYLKGSVMAYGLPALALIIGAVFGKELFSDFMPFLDPDVVSALFGFGALIICLVIVKLWSARAEKRMEYKPVIEEILND